MAFFPAILWQWSALKRGLSIGTNYDVVGVSLLQIAVIALLSTWLPSRAWLGDRMFNHHVEKRSGSFRAPLQGKHGAHLSPRRLTSVAGDAKSCVALRTFRLLLILWSCSGCSEWKKYFWVPFQKKSGHVFIVLDNNWHIFTGRTWTVCVRGLHISYVNTIWFLVVPDCSLFSGTPDIT